MKINNTEIITRIHLIISVFIVVPAAFVYGLDLGTFLELTPDTVDEQSFFKSIMGLYLAFAVVWILGIVKTSFFKPALITNFMFMLGLAFGRLFSIYLDGVPSEAYIFGTFGEFALGFYGLWVFNNHRS